MKGVVTQMRARLKTELPASDLGRRIRQRRAEMGLSVERAAAGASIDPAYLEYLESARDSDPSRATLVRLALVLDTSPAALRGADQLAPPGRGAARPRACLDELDRDQCFALIAPGGVGRFVYLDRRGPVAVPVNFRMDGEDVVFRTAATTSLSARATQLRVSFEVDHIDEALSEGWSVLISGAAHHVEEPEELARVRSLGVEPWAGGARDRYLRIRPQEVSGRRIRDSEDPV